VSAAAAIGAGGRDAAPGPHPVLADLDPELHGLQLDVPASVLEEGEEHRGLRPRAGSDSVL
jgi:hypothetical protein